MSMKDKTNGDGTVKVGSKNMNNDIYTSQYGNTQQGQGVQNLMDTLGATAATMQSQQGTFEGQTQSRLAGEAGIPELSQGAADLGKIFQLYLADSNLAQKYAAPSQQSTPPTAQGYQALADNPSQATLPDNSQGFTGFTTPSINTRAMMTTPNAVQSALENLMGALSTQRTNVKDYTGMASKNYQGTIEALLGLSDRLYQQEKDKKSEAAAQRGEVVEIEDENGNMQKVLMNPYTGEVIRVIGKSGQNLTSAEKTTKGFAEGALTLLDRFENTSDFDKTNPVSGGITKLTQNIIPGIADPTLMSMQSQIGPIRDQVLNVISGANVSAQEAERILSWIPDISKSKQKNQEDLTTLKNWLKVKAKKQIDNTSGGSTDSNDPLGIR